MRSDFSFNLSIKKDTSLASRHPYTAVLLVAERAEKSRNYSAVASMCLSEKRSVLEYVVYLAADSVRVKAVITSLAFLLFDSFLLSCHLHGDWCECVPKREFHCMKLGFLPGIVLPVVPLLAQYDHISGPQLRSFFCVGSHFLNVVSTRTRRRAKSPNFDM